MTSYIEHGVYVSFTRTDVNCACPRTRVSTCAIFKMDTTSSESEVEWGEEIGQDEDDESNSVISTPLIMY